MSTDKPTLGIDKKRKDSGEASKEYKKPKTLKQLTLEVKKEEPNHPIPKGRTDRVKEQPISLKECPEAITDIRAMLVRVLDRQDTAQACIDRLLNMCLQEEPGDSSGDEGLVQFKK